jgi:hypothetical protein
MKKNIASVLILAALVASGCSSTTPTPTTSPTALQLPTDTATPQPTLTLTPTIIPTSTPSPTTTPDFSIITFDYIYFEGTNRTVFVFTLNGAQGIFTAVGTAAGTDFSYECKTLPDQPDKLYCFGPFQAPGREMVFKLSETNRIDPILTFNTIMPSLYPPTPVGMWCEIEPLWINFGGDYGCYVVTCLINGVYVDEGTPNTCEQPWRYGPVP